LTPPPTDSVRAADAVSQRTHVTNKLVVQSQLSSKKGCKANNAQDDIRQDARGNGVSGEEEKEYEKGYQKHCPCRNKKEVPDSISLSQVSVIMVIVETRD